MSKRKKGCLGAAVVLLLVSTGVLIYLMQDDPPPEDSDLILAFTPGADADNGNHLLATLYEANRQALEESGWDEYDDTENIAADDPDATAKWAKRRDYLHAQAALLDGVADVLAKPNFHGPWPPDPANHYAGLTAGIHVARLLNDRARLHLHDGKPGLAWADLVTVLKLGNRMETSKQALVGYLVALTMKAITLQNICTHSLALAPDRATTLARTRELEGFRLQPQNLQEVFRTEYMHVIASEKYILGDEPLDILTEEDDYLPNLLYKRYHTRAIFAGIFRDVIRNCELPRPERDLSHFREVLVSVANIPWIDWTNFTGGAIVALTMPMIDAIFDKLDEVNTDLELARLALALAAYANEHGGELPATLEALVPGYMDAIPVDPFSGQAFHYDAAQRKVWSVGKDLKDNGGLSLGDRSKREPHDIVIEIPILERGEAEAGRD